VIWLCYSPSITHLLLDPLLPSNVGDIGISRDQSGDETLEEESQFQFTGNIII
jgi:hypothetical protein